MGCKPCPHHCPRGSGGLLAVLGLVLAAVLAVILGQVLASVFAVLMVTGGVIGATGIANLAYILRRNRWQPAEPREPRPPRVVVRAIPQRQAQAVSGPWARGIEAPKPGLASAEHHAGHPQDAGRAYPQARARQ